MDPLAAFAAYAHRLGVLLLAWLFIAISPALAQHAQLLGIQSGQAAEESGSIASEMAPLIERARQEGMTVIVMSPDGATGAAQVAEGPTMTERGLMIRSEIRDIILNIPEIWSQIVATLRSASPDGTMNWLWSAIAIAIGGILAGNGISWLFRRVMRKHFEALFNPEPQSRSEKVGFLLFRAAVISFNCLLMLTAGILLALIFDWGHEASRATILVILLGYVSYWVFRAVIFFNIIAHDLPNHRMINLNDEDARVMQHDLRNSMILVIVSFALCTWMRWLGLDERAHSLLLIAASLIAVIVFAALIVRHRRPVAGALLGPGPAEQKAGLRRFLASNWHFLALAYLVAAWLVSTYRLIMDLPSATILVAAPAIALIGALPLYGIVLLVVDQFYKSRRAKFELKVAEARARAREEAAAEAQARADALAQDPDADQQAVGHIAQPEEIDERHFPVFKPLYRPLVEQAAGVMIALIGLAFVLGAWGVKAGQRGNPITAFMDTIIVAFIAWFAYRAVVLFVDDRMEVEGVGPAAAANAGDMEESIGGQGASRIGTLLPLIRIVSVTTIFVLASMIILSSLGVDIAPLFAGAGVVGLAVGFGAQTLIRDIFSGGFYLFDDAFRKGEYIELGEIRGTVEKISLRSFQLRHHNGPLHTVPFGEIAQLTNYSRDWVIMKLPLRVTYDTDVERVRKLVKKVGQRLLEHPQIGHNFLQPLKSQGVVQMEDSAMIIRVKFMTKPGDQWVTRKVVYQEIRELFEREGIKFANKEVTVRIADGHAADLDERQLHDAAAAAARRAVDDESQAPASTEEIR